ncbi:MAG TPA: hypothetical protein VMR98_04975, partial [Candidatus Polarisedimenticolaceae bacterium]|nr:hypothetical protein [Candidatus Polarisedimenticolaceae bacterium]
TVGVMVPNAPLGPVERALLIGLAVVIALPSLWLLARSLWAMYIVFESELGPIQAIRASWKLTAGRTWATLGYLGALVVFLAGLLVVPIGSLVGLQSLTGWFIWQPLLQLLSTLIVAPISTLYLYRYLRNLQG